MKYINQIVFIFSLFITCLTHAMLSPLHQAIKDGNLEKVRALLDTGADMNTTRSSGLCADYTPLHVAAFNGIEAIVRLLLDRGANVNAIIKIMWNYNEITPLHLAAINDHAAIVKLLLKRGANVNAGAAFAQTPLHLIEKNNSTEIATLLRHWLKYQKLIRERQEGMLAFLMATHPHLGAESPANALPRELFRRICEFVKPTIEEVDNFEEKEEQ